MTVLLEAPTAPPAPMEIGAFFVRNWGYDQTNIDFYKVVGRTPKCLKVQAWTSRVVEVNGPCTMVVPGSEPLTAPVWKRTEFGSEYTGERAEAPVEVKRARYSYGSWRIAVSSYDSASEWNGQPQYETTTGWGH